MRESRKRKRYGELRGSEEFVQFLRNTPFSSHTTDIEKFEAFLELRTSNAPAPVDNSEQSKLKREVNKQRMREFRLNKKLNCSITSTCQNAAQPEGKPLKQQTNGNLKKDANKLRMREYRLKKKIKDQILLSTSSNQQVNKNAKREANRQRMRDLRLKKKLNDSSSKSTSQLEGDSRKQVDINAKREANKQRMRDIRLQKKPNCESRKKSADGNLKREINKLRMREFRLKRKAADNGIVGDLISGPPQKVFVNEHVVADKEFDRRFNQNPFLRFLHCL